MCENLHWTSCAIPDISRTCANECGRGTQWCRDGSWETCAVAPTRLECDNDCGRGTLLCENGKKGVCEVAPVTRECSSICGKGSETCVDGAWQRCDALQPGPPWLPATVRDFRSDFPDVADYVGERGNHDDRGLVAPTLGDDDKPVYLPSGVTWSTSGKANFDQWYRDVPGVNQSTQIRIPLTEDPSRPGVYRYQDMDFFPVDDQLFGNEGDPHNYYFTVEIATRFRYLGGEVFDFAGDDDVWVFLNRQLVIDLGGFHQIEHASANLDALATTLGLVPGEVYAMHIFFAERHLVSSDFVLETNITEFASCE